MPIYPVKCKDPACGQRCDVYSKVGARHRIKCPGCGKIATLDFENFTGISDLNSKFIGTEGLSRSEGFTRKSVPKARRLMGGEFHDVIKDDGRVVWNDSQQATRYFKRYRAVQREQRAKRGEDPDYIPPDY